MQLTKDYCHDWCAMSRIWMLFLYKNRLLYSIEKTWWNSIIGFEIGWVFLFRWFIRICNNEQGCDMKKIEKLMKINEFTNKKTYERVHYNRLRTACENSTSWSRMPTCSIKGEKMSLIWSESGLISNRTPIEWCSNHV